MRLSGRVAIVTGAARNIGRDYCLGLATEGAKVVVADLRDPQQTVDILRSRGAEAIGVTVDVSDAGSVNQMTASATDAFGRIDVLVNNAALYGDLQMGGFETLSLEAWDKTIDVNLRGCFLTMRSVLPSMRAAGGGSIINISSASIYAMGGAPHYIASKAGIIGLTRCAARDFGPYRIRVNAVAPGFTMSQASKDIMSGIGSTAMLDDIVAATALGRAEVPEDLVGTIKFLASDDARFITGQTLVVDGGWIMR